MKIIISLIVLKPEYQLIKRQSCHDIETSQLICRANRGGIRLLGIEIEA